MARTREYRFLPVAPTTPVGTGIATYFADTSGVLKFLGADAVQYTVGQVFETVLSGNFAGQIGTFASGLQPGVTGSLGSTKTFFVVTGPSGGNFAIPAYAIT